ncbi:hypothetical protein CEXT_176371 [Caerostris extrusa]|uniref:Uncharacterized protein n=1 Tax=Caerostris extrusa TaxID=172846 RepID=A0AAV4MCC2_CAEEX|nr:hypothetical protein CEXT_176371 [Caerostris extrusa]
MTPERQDKRIISVEQFLEIIPENTLSGGKQSGTPAFRASSSARSLLLADLRSRIFRGINRFFHHPPPKTTFSRVETLSRAKKRDLV